MNKFEKALNKRKAEEARKREEEKARREANTFFKKVKKTPNEQQKSVSGSNQSFVINNSDVDQSIVALHDPRSSLAEQYRTLRTNLKSLKQKKMKMFLISSAQEGEGKTVTAINLAYSFAHEKEKKVLLIDADLRRSNIAHYLGIQGEVPGFTDLLEETVSFDDAVIHTDYENLHLIVGHTNGTAPNAAELLDSRPMQKYLSEWRDEYDYIVFDSPPILPVTDAAVLGKQVDGVLMVFKAGETQKNTIKHAQHLFEQAGVNVLGYIITYVEAIAPGRKDYYYSYYRY